MHIETERLTLRPTEEKDLDDIFDYMSGEGIEASGQKRHESIEESRELAEHFIKTKFGIQLVLKETGKVIGHISVRPDSEDGREDTRELGFVLGSKYRRKGLMSEAVNAVLYMLFETRDDIEYVYACCFSDNAASEGLIRKCGFSFEKAGRYTAESLHKEFDTLEFLMTKEQFEQMQEHAEN